ncbi:MAG: hypothetical protein E7369_01110 [Clostridiales bacterium]|nr:hypothetical protein [Clostridiales bacterium]
MLDNKCMTLLRYINSNCPNGGYGVLEVKEILTAMPKKCGIDENGLRECLSTLSRGDCINLKYQDQEEVCLSTSVKGRSLCEADIERVSKTRSDNKRLFTYALIGGITGGAITALVSAVISMVMP